MCEDLFMKQTAGVAPRVDPNLAMPLGQAIVLAHIYSEQRCIYFKPEATTMAHRWASLKVGFCLVS